MALWGRKILCSFMFLLADLDPGVVGQSVRYPDPVCAVKGSTVTLPCTFTPLGSITDTKGREFLLQITRVRWCQNHLICQGPTPSVYDSQSQDNNPRYNYLGDLRGNCTLQIRDLQKEDEATLRFRMEVNHTAGHFTEQSGVNVTVVDQTQLRINRSSNETELRSGQTVTLLCSSICTFHQLEVTWNRDGHTLSETGPALRLGPLTAEDSGKYTCALKTNVDARSQPHSLFVNGDNNNLMIVGVVFTVLLALCTLILIVCLIKRKKTAAHKDQGAVGEELHCDNIYSNFLEPVERDRAGHQQEASQAVEDNNYASIQFQHKHQTRCVKETEEAVIYTSLANRG